MQSEHVNQTDEHTKLLALQEAQRRLELCLAGAGLGIWTYNIATDEFWANDRAKHLHGHEPHEVHTFEEAGANIHPEDRDRTQAAIAEAIQTGSKLQLEYRAIWRDGSIHWIASQAEFVPSSEPGKGTFYGSVQDISDRKRVEGERLRVENERKRHEADLAFLAEISQDLVHLTNIDETMDAIGAKIGEYFNVSRCNFAEIDAAADEAVITHDWHQAGLTDISGDRVYRLGDFITDEFYQTARAGEIIVVCDTRTDSRTDDAAYAPLDTRAFVTAPFIRDGQWRFLMSISDSEPRDWRDDEIELMRELTTRIWARVERARVEAALRESELKYRSLFDSIDEGVTTLEIIFNENDKAVDYRFLETNPAITKMTGLTAEIIGKTVSEVVPNLEAFWFETFDRVVKTGEPMRFEYQVGGLSDNWFEVYAARVGGEGSRTVVTVFNNITDRKRAEAAMRSFFSNVSHEFRTPLTLLLSSIQETANDPTHPLSSAQRSQLELAQRNGIRLLKLVNTLLDVSRIEAGRMEAVYKPTDLATLTTELASSFESAATQAGLQLVIDCPPLPEPVFIDRELWEKIILNLLSNAFKFTFTGEITVRLRQDSQVELTIQDTGIGIAATEVPRLFERFYQVKGTRGRSFEGSGIGLSLVQELVKLHGGTIAVSSVEGEGSCFTVSIPTGFAHLPPEQIGSSRTGRFSQDASGQLENSLQNPPLPSTATGASAYVEEALGWLPQAGKGNTGTGNKNFSSHSRLPLHLSPSPASARILLVDDNADMRSYLKRLLEERWQVETAANGAIALTQIQQYPPDLVLADVMMPEMDGLQLLQTLRANPQTQSIPVILLSARAEEKDTIEGLETGADDYLIKPFSAQELMARVETHLQLALLRQERSANRFKTEFLLTVTHELQAPLALILGWVRLLQTRSLDVDTTVQALATIERNATIEAKLVKDLLDVAGLLSGKVQLKSQYVELVPLLHSVITQFRAAAIAKQIQLVETVLNVPQKNVVADGDRLKQIIANLLENAIKFTPEGGQVNVRMECVDSEIQITVADTGIGISPVFLPYVFDRFTQAEVPSRHSPGGVGIGLAIARLLVELHKGTIEVASEGVGQGTTFIVKLPFNQSTQPNPNT